MSWLQEEVTAGKGEGQEVPPHNDCRTCKQLSDTSELSSTIELLTTDLKAEKEQSASLDADNHKLGSKNRELAKSLHNQCAVDAQVKEELQLMRNSFSMQTKALAARERQLSQVLNCLARQLCFFSVPLHHNTPVLVLATSCIHSGARSC